MIYIIFFITTYQHTTSASSRLASKAMLFSERRSYQPGSVSDLTQMIAGSVTFNLVL